MSDIDLEELKDNLKTIWACKKLQSCYQAVEVIERLQRELEEARSVVKQLASAMRKSQEVGATDHLDCCADFGEFWHSALDAARQQEG